MKSFLSKIFIVAALFMAVLPVSAQQMEEPKSLLSPNVATLGSFQEPEVALYTGTPSISIPLFEVPLQDYVLPIELQYNGTSILVDQPPSWVGLGWNLSAGGVITRKVNDWPDDRRYTADCYNPTAVGYANSGYYYNYFSLTKDMWYEFDVQKDSLNCNLTPFFYLTYYDTEPDEFQFSFKGYNGHFFLNHERKWVVQCDKSVSVELIPTTIYPPFSIPQTGIYEQGFLPCKKQPACFAGFIITIEDGTQFYFGNDSNAIDFCTDFYAKQQIMTANAWHLTKIVLPNKKEITFSYQRQNFTNQMYYGCTNRGGSYFVENGYLGATCFVPSENHPSLDNIKGKLLSPVYLHEISTPTISVTFFNSIAHDLQYRKSIYKNVLSSFKDDSYHMPYVTNFTYYDEGYALEHYWNAISSNLKRYKLDSIKISSMSNTDQKKIVLNYIEDDSVRLSLSKIILADNSTYHFDYNNLELLPHYLSFKVDHWGYYNNISSLIDGTSSTTNYYQKRQANPIYAKYGLLTKLYHPTGAVTQFDYESHDYQKQVSETRWSNLTTFSTKQYGGGARIRKISHFENEDDNIPTSWTEYFYSANYILEENSQTSSGISSTSFVYQYSYTEYLLDSDAPLHSSIFSSYSVVPNAQKDAYVCYSEITEKKSSGGYTVYKYSSFDDYLDEAPISSIQPSQLTYGKYTSKDMNRGLLTSKTEYDEDKRCIRKQIISYTPNKLNDNYIRMLDWRQTYIATDCAPRLLDEGCAYKIYTHTMVPETIRDVWYSSTGDSIVKTIKNTYDLNYQMPKKVEIMTLTDTITQQFIYPFDLFPIKIHGQYINEQSRICAEMIANHYYLPWEATTKKGGKVTGSMLYHYSEICPSTRSPFYVLDSIFVLGITEPITSFNPVNLLQRDSHYILPAQQSYKYDTYGNIIERTTNGVPVSYIWGYNFSYIVAKVVGISYMGILNSHIPATLLILLNSPMGPTSYHLNTLRTKILEKHPQAQCYTYQYNPLYGIIRETDTKGQTLFYDYDVMGRLKEVYYKENNTKRVVKKYKYHLKDVEQP